MKGEKKMNESLKIKTLIIILIAGILLTSSNSMPLVNAQPTPTSLTLAVSSPPLGKPFWSECTMEATLKDENGNPLPNMDIHFSECGSVRERIGTAKTDCARASIILSTIQCNYLLYLVCQQKTRSSV
jgi:hypothetical protein